MTKKKLTEDTFEETTNEVTENKSPDPVTKEKAQAVKEASENPATAVLSTDGAANIPSKVTKWYFEVYLNNGKSQIHGPYGSKEEADYELGVVGLPVVTSRIYSE